MPDPRPEAGRPVSGERLGPNRHGQSEVVDAARELLGLMELEHWCHACEATQQGDPEADWCPISQHLNALRSALDNHDARLRHIAEAVTAFYNAVLDWVGHDQDPPQSVLDASKAIQRLTESG